MRRPQLRLVHPGVATTGDRVILFDVGDLITGSVATAIEHDAIRHAMLLGDGSAIAFELTVPAGSAAAGKAIMELAALPGFPSSCVFAALYQADGSVEAPRGSTVVQVGTTVLLVSRADEVGRAVKTLTDPVESGAASTGRQRA